MHNKRLLGLLMLVAVIGLAGGHAHAKQQCGSEEFTGTATAADEGAAILAAGRNWSDQVIARLSTSMIFHQAPKLACETGKAGYTCTIKGKACTDPELARKVQRRPFCGQSGDCQVCCGTPGTSDYSCRFVCE